MGERIIKICGLSTRDGMAASVAAGAQWLGLVFVGSSPRAVTLEAAQALAKDAPVGSQIIGLFADCPAETVAHIARRVPLDKIQLHGQETAADIASIRAATGRPVIVARGVASAGDVARLSEIDADYLLIDAKPPPDAEAKGGHGQRFDWGLLGELDTSVPWLLAGGLTPENVASAIATVRSIPGFSGVDVSSGVEQARGVKDPARIAAFVKAARTAMRSGSQFEQ